MAKQTREETERQLIEIIATDRIYRPISSTDGKLKRRREKLAESVELKPGQKFDGERVYARVEENEIMKARGMREAIDEFAKKYPREGKILEGLIAEQRKAREINLYFEMYEGCRLTAEDYMHVMTSLGFTEATAERLYPELMDISRKMAKKKQDERSLMLEQSFK